MIKQKPTADKGYTRKKAAGDDGWGGKESAYDKLKARIEMSLRQVITDENGDDLFVSAIKPRG